MFVIYNRFNFTTSGLNRAVGTYLANGTEKLVDAGLSQIGR